jgi:P27 family predicted phage terminase small subunit
MGLRGPQPKPAELKLLEGNRGHRPVTIDQLFRPEVGSPDIPKWLTPDARKAWRRLSTELVRYNLLSKVDRDAFAMLCQTLGRIEILERSMTSRCNALTDANKDPVVAFFDKTPNGMVIQSALYQVLKREQESAHKMLESFGLRPDARARVTTAIRAQLQLFEGGKGDGTKGPAADGFAGFE